MVMWLRYCCSSASKLRSGVTYFNLARFCRTMKKRFERADGEGACCDVQPHSRLWRPWPRKAHNLQRLFSSGASFLSIPLKRRSLTVAAVCSCLLLLLIMTTILCSKSFHTLADFENATTTTTEKSGPCEDHMERSVHSLSQLCFKLTLKAQRVKSTSAPHGPLSTKSPLKM